MIIKRNYTLSQFVKYIWNYAGISDGEKLRLIAAYDTKTDKKPSKEMFVNLVKIELPIENRSELDIWKEAEKKVIFKGWKPVFSNDANVDFAIANGLHTIEFLKNGKVYYNDSDVECLIKTLEDLAKATNGELETEFEL